MRRRSFQTKLLLAALSAAVLALLVAGLLFATSMRRQIDARIENTLIAEAQLAAELLGRAEDSSALPLYAAVPVAHSPIAYVRLALPLTTVRQQVGTVLRLTSTALGLAFAGALAIALFMTARLGRRVRAIAGVARRYRGGDLTPARVDYGDDELGVVARALDDTVQELARRLADLARDRGRMAAL